MHNETTTHHSEPSLLDIIQGAQPTINSSELDPRVLELTEGKVVFETSIGSIKEAKISILNSYMDKMAPSYIRMVALFPSENQVRVIKLLKAGVDRDDIIKDAEVSRSYMSATVNMARRFGLLSEEEVPRRGGEGSPDHKERLATGRAVLLAKRLKARVEREEKRKAELSRTVGTDMRRVTDKNGKLAQMEQAILKQAEAINKMSRAAPISPVVPPAPVVQAKPPEVKTAEGKTRVSLDLTTEQMAKLFNLLNEK